LGIEEHIIKYLSLFFVVYFNQIGFDPPDQFSALNTRQIILQFLPFAAIEW